MVPNEVEQRLREIEERVSQASPGPWEVHGLGGIHMDGRRDGYGVVTANGKRLHAPFINLSDARFVAYAREDVPWLLSLLREREEENRRLREALQRISVHPCGYTGDGHAGGPSYCGECRDMRAIAEAALRGGQP